MDQDIRDQIAEVIATNYRSGDRDLLPAGEDPLLEHGVVDSTGVLEQVEFLEVHIGIAIAEAETVAATVAAQPVG